MKKKPKIIVPPDPSADPSKEICPIYDETGIKTYHVASPETMGVRVVDNCAEEHQQ